MTITNSQEEEERRFIFGARFFWTAFYRAVYMIKSRGVSEINRSRGLSQSQGYD
jgi:hypothetical protein